MTATSSDAGRRSLTDLPEWRALEAHANEMRSVHLRSLFAADSNRGEKLVVEGAGLYFDYSKHRVTDETIANFNVPGYTFGTEVYTRIGLTSNGYAVGGGRSSRSFAASIPSSMRSSSGR